ncbi:MAG: ATP-binding protein, partial [Devosia sp.]|nr:ATP-binding protein [Devosia sp.]
MNWLCVLTSSRSAESLETVARLADAEVEARLRDWSAWAYEQQQEPQGDWTTWLFMGGRGCGKTRTGAEWVRSLAARGVS